MTIGIVGGKGKLGSVICNVIKTTSENIEAVIIESTNELFDTIDKVDVYIDCTSVNAFMQNVNAYRIIGRPLVLATTGFSDDESKEIQELSREIPVIKAANFSIGVYKYLKIVEYATGLLGDEYEIGIIEKHHRNKKDFPSGTANEMIKVIHKVIPGKKIDVNSIRMFDIVGEHELYFRGAGGEMIEISHRIFNREGFANGAITAAKWVLNMNNGLYSMSDMLE